MSRCDENRRAQVEEVDEVVGRPPAAGTAAHSKEEEVGPRTSERFGDALAVIGSEEEWMQRCGGGGEAELMATGDVGMGADGREIS